MTEKRAALLYAAAIIATDRFSHHDDPLTVGIVQVGVLGLLALILSSLLLPHLMKGKKSHEIQGDPV